MKRFLKWLSSFNEKPAAESVEVDPWVKIALKDVGTVEQAGEKHNKRILEFHQNCPQKFGNDEVPWCATAVSTWLKEAGMKSPDTAWSKAFLEYGKELVKPKFGCIVIFYRGHKSSHSGHVGFYLGKVREHILVLGGNQGDAVTILQYPTTKVLGYRWPVERRV